MFLGSVLLMKSSSKQNKKMMKNKTPIFVQFFYLQKLPITLDGVIGVYNYVFFV